MVKMLNKRLKRNPVLTGLLALLTAGLLLPTGCSAPATDTHAEKVLVIGIDGMDPALFRRFRDEGVLPNFVRLAEAGGFSELQTTPPPQSPVAWSSFIIGGNPGRHGIFDFLHRSPETLIPKFSTTSTEEGSSLTLGSWKLPISSGAIHNLRQGEPFWSYLDRARIPAVISRVPANYPPVCPCQNDTVKLLSGMGTPDLLGTQGTFSFYTENPARKPGSVGGGRIMRITPVENRATAVLRGPPHPYAADDSRRLELPFTIWRDSEHPASVIEVGSQRLVLKEGEFSEWVPLEFSLLSGLESLRGAARFYLKQVRPHLELYVSPLNIDPGAAALPISIPPEYAEELAAEVGPFYTQNMPPDTKALQRGVFDTAEFLKQARLVFDEEERLLQYELQGFRSGLLFHYFGIVDQVSHMLWAAQDPEHPAFTPEDGRRFGNVIRGYYIEMDRILGSVLDQIDRRTTLLVLSDHGFNSFRRGVNLNSVLRDAGFLSVQPGYDPRKSELLRPVNWQRTKAYALGINSLYLNVRGRERSGTVTAADYDRVLNEVRTALLNFKDPDTGAAPIRVVLDRRQAYSGPMLKLAPDLIVGYAAGYRASWNTALGGIPAATVEDNLEAWTGDHAVDHTLVPGVLFSNRRIIKEQPTLMDMAPTILKLFGVSGSAQMEGTPVL